MTFSSGTRVDFEPAEVERVFARVLQREHDLEERIASRIADRVQLLDQFLERQVLVGIRIDRAIARALQELDEGGLPDRSPRMTSVLTKKPISPSSSGRPRPAIGVPTAMSSCPE